MLESWSRICFEVVAEVTLVMHKREPGTMARMTRTAVVTNLVPVAWKCLYVIRNSLTMIQPCCCEHLSAVRLLLHAYKLDAFGTQDQIHYIAHLEGRRKWKLNTILMT